MKKKILLLILVLCVGWALLPYNILILGSDTRSENLKGSRTDGIILVKVMPYMGTIKMVSIPRDSYVEIYGKDKYDKITHAFAIGGTDESMETIEKFLNTNINYNVIFKFEDIVNITNILDGVDIVSNHSFVQDGFKFIKGQKYTVKGEQALAYARHRKTDSDFKRGERQRQLMKSIIYKMVSPSGIKKVPEILAYSKTHMNLSYNPLKIIPSLLGLINIKQYEVKGSSMRKNGIYYFVPSEESIQEIRDNFKIYF